MEQMVYSMVCKAVEDVMTDVRNAFGIETDEIAEEDEYKLFDKQRELAIVVGGILRKEMKRR